MFTKSAFRHYFPQDESEFCWTLLLLTPSNFFPSHNDIDHSSFSRSSVLNMRDIAIQKCMLTAELTSILYGMRLVVQRWEQLYQHIEGLLHEDFMDPATYVELLFDDENFSQSRLYFWVIGCVNEFQISIEDNIKQWTLFREARVESYLERNSGAAEESRSFASFDNLRDDSPKKIKNLAKKIDAEVESLINCQSQFKHQQETAQAFRDGVSDSLMIVL